jgi:alpha-glucosidase
MTSSIEPRPATAAQRLWWQHGVVYQIYVRSFQDSDGDGLGDLAGILQRLDYLSEVLGVDAIWLTPFYPSPMIDGGYDIANHTDVDPRFGDLATFDRLLGAAHRRGLKVIVDFVPNHTSSAHPWFQQSRSSRSNPYRDWYIWRDPKPDNGPPNNWLSVFGGSAWAWDAATAQYYLHSFDAEQPDLNWRNPAVQAAMFDVARFWLERGVDGFRVDVASLIMKDPELRDNPPDPDPEPIWVQTMGEWALQLHLYDLQHPDVHRVYREFRQLLDSYSAAQPRMAIGELHDRDLSVWASFYGPQLDELHLPFNFHLLGAAWESAAVRAVVTQIEAAIAPGAWPNWVLGNHDQARIASRLGAAHARLAMLLLLTLRGTPTLYYGDELGMPNVPIAPEQAQDQWEYRAPGQGLGRDPQRAPMQWDATANAGFCPPDTTPWLPLAPDARQLNVAAQLADPRSMLSLTRALLRLRRAEPALTYGSYRTVEAAPEGCFAYLRVDGAAECLIVLNFAPDTRLLELPAGWAGVIALSTCMDRRDERVGGALPVRGGEGVIALRAGP